MTYICKHNEDPRQVKWRHNDRSRRIPKST